ncbi:MAG: DUF748 domain-containing protein, partial [Desulfuromusa sp.]|nr:DUF748 domain-containing protein [Desulfuromusa sp.]
LLQHPKIFITRMSNGQFNYSDLLSEPASGDKTTTSGKTTTGAHSKSPAIPALNLLIKVVEIKGGELFYVDRFKNSRSPFRYTLEKLNFKARQITFASPFPVDLSAVVNGSNIDISGSYDLSRKIGDLTIHLAPLDLLPFAPYYRTVLPGKLSSAQLALELELDIQPDLIVSQGKVLFEDVDLVLDNIPDLQFKKAQLGASYAFDFDTKKELLKVSNLLLNFNKVELAAEGEFDLSAAEPYMVSTLFLKGLDLREVMQNLPEQLAREYQKYSLAGLIDGQIDFSGKLDSGIALVRSAQFKLSELRATIANLRAGVSGDITYADNILQTENLFLHYGDQKIELKGQVEKGVDDIFRGVFDLSADTLDLNKVLAEPENQPEPGLESKSATVGDNRGNKATGAPQIVQRKTLADDIGPFDIPVAMDGTFAVNRLIYKKLNIDKISADLSLSHNDLSITNLVGQIGQGELRGSTLVDFGIKGLSYLGEMSLSQPEVATLVSGLFPEVKQSISGSLQMQNNFSGRGTLADTLLPALKLKGTFKVKEGSVEGFPLLDQLADFVGRNKLKTLSFKSLTAQYDLDDGLARINGNLNSSKTKLISTGTVTIDGHLNLNLDARFSPKVLGKLGLNKVLKKTVADPDGWGTLPLLIRGTLDHPQVSYNSVALQDQVIEKASQKLLEKLVPEGDGNAEPIKKLLDNTLNKLFGK